MAMQLVTPEKAKQCKKHKDTELPIFFSEFTMASNSFVGTEEYIAPVSSFFCNWCRLNNLPENSQSHCWGAELY
jgi:hypothetical protein